MTKEQAIKTAVEWWADKLKARLHHSNGDNGRASVMACFLADLGAKPVTDAQLDIFKKELRTRIEGGIDNRSNWGEVYLGCDYNPTMNLYESAVAAGISEYNFPYKTDMYVQKREDNCYVVTVYAGYGAGRTVLDPVE